MPWKDVFLETKEAGYTASEMGPYNYLPIDAAESAQFLVGRFCF